MHEMSIDYWLLVSGLTEFRKKKHRGKSETSTDVEGQGFVHVSSVIPGDPPRNGYYYVKTM